ncbi:MAG: ABC transporter substrate-binding protein [Chloroflexota bacterium]
MKRIQLFVAFVLLFLILAACGGENPVEPEEEAAATAVPTEEEAEPEEEEVVEEESSEEVEEMVAKECEAGFRLFEHEYLGDPVCIPNDPQRIAVFDANMTSVMIQLDIAPVAHLDLWISGMRDSHPEVSDQIDKVIGESVNVGFPGEFNLEAILEVDPDIILTAAHYIDGVEEEMSAIAPVIAYDYFTNSAADYEAIISLYGEAINAGDEIDQLLAGIDDRIETLKANLDNAEDTTVSFLAFYGSPDLQVLLSNWPASRIMREVGLSRPEPQNVDNAEATELYGNPYSIQPSIEELPNHDADYIVTMVFASGDDMETTIAETVTDLQEGPLWQQLEGVKNGNAYTVGGHWVTGGIYDIHKTLDDMFEIFVGVDPAEISPNPVLGADTMAAADSGVCDAGFRLFDHELLATDPVCVPENPEEIAMIETFGIEAMLLLDQPPVVQMGPYLDQLSGNFPDLAPQIESVFGSLPDAGYFPPNFEVMIEAQPDLIITFDFFLDQAEQFEAIGPTVFIKLVPAELTVPKLIDFHADLWAGDELIDAALEPYLTRAEAMGEALGDQINGKDIVVGRYDGNLLFFGGAPPYLLLEDAGWEPRPEFAEALESIRADFPFGMQPVSLEELQVLDGDYLFIYDLARDMTEPDVMSEGLAELLDTPLWEGLTVVQNDQRFIMDTRWNFNSVLAAHYVIDDIVEAVNPEVADSIPPNPFVLE